MALLEIENLSRHFAVRGPFGFRTGLVRALDGASFGLDRGETLGVLGATGSGKSTLGRAVAGILRPTAGVVRLAGEVLPPRRSLAMRARLQYAHQDPGAALDPRWTIRRSLHEPLVIHRDWSARRRAAEIEAILGAVGLGTDLLDRRPHELSGGQRRRAGLARVLLPAPRIAILDEPTAALDVPAQAAVLALLAELRARFELSCIVISHDVAVVGAICDRIAVMDAGRIVEIGPAAAVLARPSHPCTCALVAATPVIGGPRLTDRLIA